MFEWIDGVDTPLLIVDIGASLIVAANRPARAFFDGALDRALPAPFAEIVHVAGAVPWPELVQPELDGRARAFPMLLPGNGRTVHCSVRPLTDTHRLINLMPAVGRDFQNTLLEILDDLPVGIEIYNRDLIGTFYNKASDELFLYDQKPIVHHDDWWEFGFPDPQERAAAYAEWKAKTELSRQNPAQVQYSEWKVRCNDGSTRNVQFRYRWVRDHYVLALWDVTTERETERHLRDLAVSDPLTGLWNRRRLVEDGHRALALGQSEGSTCSLLMLDLDRFKQINDGHGHAAGDEVLRAVAERGLAQLRRSDIMARIGGEEFAVLLPRTSGEDARAIAARMLEALSVPVALGDGTVIEVTASIGVTWTGPAGEDFAALLRRCDQALYEAKSDGRNRIVVFPPPAP
ncbi:GGDEF domain-containing protein [Starkeya koreensis]|uniref:GGDEF domain-containing protein n=1 Tax=Ancylobacter koreensis TaxID=266121 RepID=A0ABT0DPG9_9HYPH|nr:GGDEF domain-containing protein [Ancylobacter koreensis]MCK0209174.1 GGDEF domain-containing protein [Ancylobacter koreensis]